MPTKLEDSEKKEKSQRPKAIVAWSSGKDSALALYKILQAGEYEVVSLVTTVTEGVDRVSMHGVREELLERQAHSIGIPLYKVKLPFPCPNAIYEERVTTALLHWKNKGVTHIIFGDLHLEDVRKYREEKIMKNRMQAIYPLWGENTKSLSQQIVKMGFKAVLTCVDSKKLEPTMAGRNYDEKFLKHLPSSVDPCGENGEFHTFVFGGPLFHEPIAFSVGDRVSRQGFEFADIVCG